MKKEKDIGLKYMMELSIRPAKTCAQFFSIIQDKYGKERADVIKHFFNKRYDDEERGEGSDDAAFYKLKNSNTDMSIDIAGSYGGDFFRKACNYISYKADKLQNCTRILEVGCDCGILSCFLGRTFPTAQIVAIDRCKEAITVAKELASRLGVHNITFLHADVHDLHNDKFDAIFSIRVMHENCLLDEKEDTTLLMGAQGDKFAKATGNYAKMLSNNLADNGLLISIERTEMNPLFYGWMLALNENNIVVRDYTQICCKELEEESYFQTIEAKRVEESLSKEEVWNRFLNYFFGDNKELTKADFTGWESFVVLQELHGKLLDGVFAYANGEKVGKLAIWESKSCETDIIFEQRVLGKTNRIGIRDKRMMGEIIQQFSKDKELMKKEWGFTLIPFKLVDDEEIELSADEP